jgi:hypothetical protein
MRERPDLTTMSDDKLLRGLFDVLNRTRHNEADLIAHIAEVDARELYAREAAPSLFAWCIERLHFSEQEAYARITVARASRKHPMLLTMLRDGRLHLSGIVRLVPHLTVENRQAVLRRATHKSKRQIEELIAELEPKPDARAKIRKLPERRAMAHPSSTPESGSGSGGSDGAEVCPDSALLSDDLTGLGGGAGPKPQLCPGRVGTSAKPAPHGLLVQAPAASRQAEPLAPARYKVQFTASAELRDKLERLQALMRSSVPDGDLAKIIDMAVTEKLERLEARRFAKTKRPRKRLAQTDTRPKSRYIPAAVRRFVEKRDGGRCTYQDRHGRRCTKRHDLEYHHRKPFGRGGDHSPEGLALMCRTHNALLAEQDFGKEKMARCRRGASRASEPAAAPSGLARRTDRATQGAGSPSGSTIHAPPAQPGPACGDVCETGVV